MQHITHLKFYLTSANKVLKTHYDLGYVELGRKARIWTTVLPRHLHGRAYGKLGRGGLGPASVSGALPCLDLRQLNILSGPASHNTVSVTSQNILIFIFYIFGIFLKWSSYQKKLQKKPESITNFTKLMSNKGIWKLVKNIWNQYGFLVYSWKMRLLKFRLQRSQNIWKIS